MYQYPSYMYHYGVKGMKWGVRRRQDYAQVKSARKNYKAAKKQYSKDYKKAYRYSKIPRFTKKGKATRDALWDNATASAKNSNTAKNEYKSLKEKYENTNYKHSLLGERAIVYGSIAAVVALPLAVTRLSSPSNVAKGKKVVDSIITSAKLAGGHAIVDGKRTKIDYL